MNTHLLYCFAKETLKGQSTYLTNNIIFERTFNYTNLMWQWQQDFPERIIVTFYSLSIAVGKTLNFNYFYSPVLRSRSFFSCARDQFLFSTLNYEAPGCLVEMKICQKYSSPRPAESTFRFTLRCTFFPYTTATLSSFHFPPYSYLYLFSSRLISCLRVSHSPLYLLQQREYFCHRYISFVVVHIFPFFLSGERNVLIYPNASF